MTKDLQEGRQAQIRAILSNGGYLQSEKGLEARKAEIESLNDHYDKVIDEIMDPGRSAREQKAMEENPLFAAGMRGLDRLKWELNGAEMVSSQLREQGIVR